MLRRWRDRRKRADEDERGFGLLELMIASGVMLSALTSMAYVATNSFYDIAAAKQRQTAVALADEAVEQLRALPYATLAVGVRSADLAGDPRVIGAGTTASPYLMATTNERVVHAPTNQTVAPLVPNSSNHTVDQVVYAVRTYVSYFDDNPAIGTYTTTVYVDWNGGRRTRAAFVRAITVIFSPAAAARGRGGTGSGSCTNLQTHPFAGLCAASFTASASADAGDMMTTGGGTVGLALAGASNELPYVTSTMAVGNAVVVGGTGTGGGVTMGSTKAGHTTASTNADDDPSTLGVGPYAFAVGPSPGAIGLSSSAGLGTISVTGTAGDTSESASAVAPTAVAPPAANACKNPAGVAQTDGRPCGRSVASQASTLKTTYDVTGLGLGTVTMTEELAPLTNTVAFTKHYTSSASGPCAGTSNVGCVHAEASRSYDKVHIGGLPTTALLPLGFLGYLAEISGYSDTATAEAGIGAGPPTMTASGTMKYWSGGGYTTVVLSPGVSTKYVTAGVTVSVGLYTVVIPPSTVGPGPSSSTSTTATCLQALALPCRTYADATIGSPMTGTVTYSFRLLGVEVYKITTTMDLGTLTANATYVDPP